MNKIKKFLTILEEHGVGEAFKETYAKIFKGRIDNYNYIKNLFFGKSGIEIGGPSGIFKDGNFIPLYNIVKVLDGCNFSNTTIWEGNLKNGETYNYYKNKNGFQYISEATDLAMIPNFTYDFLISCNCLEHVANPLKAMAEWIRIIKKGGLLLLTLPNKDFTFDHNRQVTKFEHLLQDFNNDIKEDDMTHFNEIMMLHDLSMDKHAGNLSQFKERSLKNFENRTMHHHVFNKELLIQIFSYFNLKVLLTYAGEKYSTDFIILGSKIE